MNAVMLSIRPQWCELIANGKKTIEVRKNRPKLEIPFKCYIYCTAPKKFYKISEHMATSAEYLHLCDGKVTMSDGFEFFGRADYKVLNRKVIGEFVCDYVKMETVGYINHIAGYHSLESGSCLTAEQLMDYGKWAFLYGWHISGLQIYDKPKELSEFKQCHKCPYGPIERCNEHEFSCDKTYSLNRPFQSWGYVEELV